MRDFFGKIKDTVLGSANEILGSIQRSLGEDYYEITEKNPLVRESLVRSEYSNSPLFQTVFNIPWTTTLFWSSAAGSTLCLQHEIGESLGELMHYGPGHVQRWSEINEYIDTAVGIGHRLKFGHAVTDLPVIVEKFGVEGIPAWCAHMAQDFTTVHGVPVIPNAWEAKEWLAHAGVSSKMAMGLVSVSFSSILGAMALVIAASKIQRVYAEWSAKRKLTELFEKAGAAIEGGDHKGALHCLSLALEIDRDPRILLSFGQLCQRRVTSRLKAHKAFDEAVTRFSSTPAAEICLGGARLSARGVAALHALATADVLADIHPEHWRDHLEDLTNAAICSFAQTAKKQDGQADDYVPDTLVTPGHFSAALNYYLAAKSAAHVPLIAERREKVTDNLRKAVKSIGCMAQYNEERLRPIANKLIMGWAGELLQPKDVELELSGYLDSL